MWLLPEFQPPVGRATRGFEATMKDPAFLAEAKKQDLECCRFLARRADALIRDVYATPAEIVKLAIDYMKE